MHSTFAGPRTRALGLVALLSTLAALGQGCGGCSAPPPVPLEETPASGALVFPPPDDTWRENEPLPAALRPAAGGVAAKGAARVTSPRLDDKGHFEILGQTIELELDAAAVDVKAPDLPVVTVTPKVSARTVWTSPYRVELRADAPFDPAVTYTLDLPEIATTEGKKVPAFHATFNARPKAVIAGKIIHYAPRPGVARPIYARPIEDRDIGPAQEIFVIYDQPVDLELARKLVTIKTEAGAAVPLVLSHPPGPTFEGEKVDPRDVVLVKMAPMPPPGTKVVFEAKSQREADAGERRSFTVAELPLWKGAQCADCASKDGTLEGDASATVTLEWSNPVARRSEAKKHLQIAPTPRNLSVSGWDGSLMLDAAWTPQTTYTIRASGLVDRFGRAMPDGQVVFRTRPRSSIAVLREGPLLLDPKAAREFFVTTRNVKSGELRLWPVADGQAALVAALERARANDPPSGTPTVIPFAGNTTPDVYVESAIDLSGKVQAGKAYLAMVEIKEAAFGATRGTSVGAYGYTGYSNGKPSVPLLLVAAEGSLGAHVHWAGERAAVAVYRVGTGEPAPNVGVTINKASGRTDAAGVALLDVGRTTPSERSVVLLEEGGALAAVPLEARLETTSAALYPALASGDAAPASSLLGFVLTDRGVYRPGSTMRVKGIVRRADDAAVRPAAGAKVRLHVVDAVGSDVIAESREASAAGAIALDVALPEAAPSGRYHVRLETDDEAHSVLHEELVRVAPFEIPRFKVDVEPGKAAAVGRFQARVVGTYAFGAPMAGGSVAWTLRKKAAPVPAVALVAQGFQFGVERSELEGPVEPKDEPKPITGEGKLGRAGELDLDVALGAIGPGPTEVTLEADVTDASYRHVAGRTTAIRHPFGRYAGVRIARRFGEAGPVSVEAVVVDVEGRPLVGIPVEMRLDAITWKRTAEKVESGASVEAWRPVHTPAGTCPITSGAGPVGCAIPVKDAGSYRVVARIDGRDDAASFYDAWWGSGWRGGDGEAAPAVPSAGKRVAVSTDKRTYVAGETAKVLAQSPFPEALALLTIEKGGVARHEARRVRGSQVVFDVPIASASAPFTHAVVTLLPIAAKGVGDASFRVGAVRIPVAMDDARLSVKVVSDKKTYDVRQNAELVVEVTRKGQPVKGADVTLALVDEGVLRLTNHHAKDPTDALHPSRPLEFTAWDSRQLLFRRRERAHVAGGGGADDDGGLDARRNFVETAAWFPALVTDAEGRAKVKVELPDNLGELRMMATAVDPVGAAGVAESSFLVTRPFLLEPIIPAFVLFGDKVEVGVMAHNNTDAEVKARVRMIGETREIVLPAHGHARVVQPLAITTTQKVVYAIEVDGRTKDKVEKVVKVAFGGIDEHPHLSGVFRGSQDVTLAIPEDAAFPEDARLTIRAGAALYPELGQRLAYLLDYPHGCVEQTTSSTLPLLAAKNLLPWAGVTSIGEDELRKRIKAGVARLASMKTSQGGLAYWPGGTDPNVYGTVYATRALVRAKAEGIQEPGLLDDVLGWLGNRLTAEHDPSMRVAIAEALALSGKLPESAADSLWDTREKLDTYGLASLALALSTLPKQTDRTKTVLDLLEASFDDAGVPKMAHGTRDWHWFGSADRDRAQALVALVKLRPSSKLGPVLAARLSKKLGGYTTQATAWSLLALSDFVGSSSPRGSVDVKMVIPGFVADTTRSLGGSNKEVTLRLADLRGKKVQLRLEGDAKTPVGFAIDAKYTRSSISAGRFGKHTDVGPTVHRVFTDALGRPVDLAAVKAGDVVRVALRVDLPRAVEDYRASYVAVTDRLAAGFEPIQPELATVAQLDATGKEHPFFAELSAGIVAASHVDVREDRVSVYFDRAWARTLYATYLLRATTPGDFSLPPARAELMYEPGSEGYSDAGRVTVR